MLAVVVGCSSSAPGSTSAALHNGGAQPPAPSTVTVQGQVARTDGVGLVGVQVLRVPRDPYLEPVLMTQSGAGGSFVMDGVTGDTRQWFVFDKAGYVGLFQAFDPAADGRQDLPTAILLTDGEAATLAQGLGATLDPGRTVIRVPLVTTAGGQARVPAEEFQVDLQPPLDVPIHYLDGEAIVINAVAYDSYQLKVTRAGRACATALHPSLVAADGSVEIRTMPGYWTVGPTMLCP
jgi:hypothetical protein